MHSSKRRKEILGSILVRRKPLRPRQDKFKRNHNVLSTLEKEYKIKRYFENSTSRWQSPPQLVRAHQWWTLRASDSAPSWWGLLRKSFRRESDGAGGDAVSDVHFGMSLVIWFFVEVLYFSICYQRKKFEVEINSFNHMIFDEAIGFYCRGSQAHKWAPVSFFLTYWPSRCTAQVESQRHLRTCILNYEEINNLHIFATVVISTKAQ